MDDLIAFLSARLDEDEAAAMAASFGPDGAPWTDAVPGMVHIDGHWISQQWSRSSLRAYVAGSDTDVYRQHIARHDPARSLREVEAKRAIVARYERAHQEVIVYRESDDPAESLAWARIASQLELSVRALAAVWSGHPDYREEWAVPSLA